MIIPQGVSGPSPQKPREFRQKSASTAAARPAVDHTGPAKHGTDASPGVSSAMREDLPIVVITREIPGDPIEIEGVKVRPGPADAPDRDRLLAMVEGATVVVSMFSDSIDRAVLDAAGPRLRGVCNFAVGYNNIDLDACRERGIVVTNTPDAVTEGTANMAVGLLLSVARRIAEADRFVRSGAWAGQAPLSMGDWMGLDLAGKTLHIVGAGRIGYATAVRAAAFGMRVIYTSRTPKPVFEQAPLAAERFSLDDGLARADVVSLHTPLTPETRHLLDRRRLGLLKPDAILINTSRGPVVDEAALVAALRERRIWGAGLDVMEDEPLLAAGLAELDNAVLTPHIGSAERRWRAEMTRMCERAARAIIAGQEPEHRVV